MLQWSFKNWEQGTLFLWSFFSLGMAPDLWWFSPSALPAVDCLWPYPYDVTVLRSVNVIIHYKNEFLYFFSWRLLAIFGEGWPFLGGRVSKYAAECLRGSDLRQSRSRKSFWNSPYPTHRWLSGTMLVPSQALPLPHPVTLVPLVLGGSELSPQFLEPPMAEPMKEVKR